MEIFQMKKKNSILLHYYSKLSGTPLFRLYDMLSTPCSVFMIVLVTHLKSKYGKKELFRNTEH